MRATTAVLVLLAAWSSRAGARPPEDAPPPAPVVDPAAVEKAVARSLPVLWDGVEGHTARRSCFTCHNHAVPMLAFATAGARGFEIDGAKIKELTDFFTGYLADNRERMEKGRGPGDPVSGETDTTAYVFLALDALGTGPSDSTAAVVHYTLARDKSRDHWRTPVRRFPSEASSFTTTALAVRGLQKYAPAARKADAAKRVDAARAWLVKTPAADTEDRVFRLVGLRAAGAGFADIAKAAKELADSQRDDGGWGQTAKMASDAYATGSALYALHTAGGLPTTDPAYRRGLRFLLRTQEDDGSWHVRTRSHPVQKDFDAGFPHGKDQFISCAATGWATTALALSRPAKK